MGSVYKVTCKPRANIFFILITCWRRLSMNCVNFTLWRYYTLICSMYWCSRDVISFKTLLFFLRILASICRNLSKTCCNCPLIESLLLCKICVLVQYLNREIPIEIQVNCLRVKVTLNHKENFLLCNNYESVVYLSFLLHIWNVKGKKKRYIALWDKRSKVSQPVTSWLHFRSEGQS